MEQKLVLNLVLKRLVSMILIAFLSVFLCFSILHFSKASVAFSSGTNFVSLEAKRQLEANLGLDQPLLTQFSSWFFEILKGNFGTSLMSGEAVSTLLFEPFLNTLILALCALVILFILSLALALFSLKFKDSLVDQIIQILTLGFFAMPSFALALIFILIFGAFWQILPVSGLSDIADNSLKSRFLHLILPVSVLVLSHLAIYVRVARSCMLESMKQSFISNAYARGLSEKRIYFHFVLRASLVPVIAYFGANATSFIMGTYVIEGVFSYGGMGELAFKSMLFKDYPVVLALVLLSVFLVSFFNLLADICVKILNPKVKKL